MKPKILIVDDYIEHAENLKALLEEHSYQASTVYSAEDAYVKISENKFHLILLDNKLPGKDGIEFVRELRNMENDTPVIMFSAFSDVHAGHEAAQLGVYDFIPKGENLDQLYDSIEDAIQKHQILSSHKFDAQYFKQKFNFVGISKTIQKILETAQQVATSDARVLITGETGVGKNILAEVIHKMSHRAKYPFTWLFTNEIPENLLESELFGYERGAFTGANKKKIGRLAMADKGTLFLDQIDDLPLSMQSKLLRVVELGEFESISSNQTQKIDVRIISSAIKDLNNAISNKNFRQDLYYRIAQVVIFIPPLRDRKEDIIYMAKYFLRNFCLKYNRPFMEFSDGAVELLLRHSWHGNVRELQFFMERIVIFKNRGPIQSKDILALKIEKENEDYIKKLQSLKLAKQEFEKSYIIRALIQNDWNVTNTAKILGMDRVNLYKKIREHGIDLAK